MLDLTSYEQDALAEICCATQSIQYRHKSKFEAATAEQLQTFEEAIMRFDKIRWDVLYDKLHRSGANS